MGKIHNKELHKNENAAMQFGIAIADAIDRVRQSFDWLSTSRKADEYAPGAIHALRKLCDGDASGLWGLPAAEVEEWHECFLKWFERVQSKIPSQLRAGFRKQAEDDFRVLRKSACEMPEAFWRDRSRQRAIQLSFKDEAALAAAHQAAEEKHPVELGGALHSYLETCLNQLVGAPAAAASPVPGNAAETTENRTIAPRFVDLGEGRYSLCVDDFAPFGNPEDVEQDIVVTGYALEAAVKRILKKERAPLASELRFDSESSMFSVTSTNPLALALVSEVLFRLVADERLRKKMIRYQDG